MKILQLGKFFPPHWGGIETVTFNLHCNFVKNNIENSIIVFGRKSETLSENGPIHFCRYISLFGAPVSISYILAFFLQKKCIKLLLSIYLIQLQY